VTTKSAIATDVRVLAVLEEYLAERQAGRAPDREALLARHPDLAESLAASLKALDFVHDAGRTLEASPTRPDQEMPAVAGQVLGDYRILREIGRGGMAVVYEAEQISLGRRVALKVLPFAAVLGPKQTQRFKNEAQAAAHLQHPHIVPVHAVGCERGVHYYAMQYVDGQSLAVVIRELKEGGGGTGPRTPISSHGSVRGSPYIRMAATLGVQAAEALDHAHQLGIVHRDVKPGNLLVDLSGTLWVTDFGLAYSLNDVGLTMTGELLGTIRYMSPEQALAKRVPLDHRTDVYSLGATLYELFTLDPAFPGDDPHAVLRDIASKEPVAPRQLNPAIPRDLETVLLKAMSKDPSGRYATAQEMADDLERFLGNRPIEAKRPGPLRRVAKWSRRHRGLVAAAAVVLLLAVVGLVTGTALLWREQEQTRAAFDRAESNLALALKALDQIYVYEAEGHPEIREGLPRDLLERGLGFYEEFAKANASNRGAARLLGNAYHRASLIFRRLGKTAEADAALKRAISTYQEILSRAPDDARAHHSLGYSLHDLGDGEGEIREYRETLRLDPGNALAHVSLGLALFNKGDHEGAAREYREAILLNPGDAAAHSNLGNTLFHMRDVDGAMEESRHAIRLRPDLAAAHLNLGNVLHVKGDLEGAIREYREGIRLIPRVADVAGTLPVGGDLEVAIREYRAGVRLTPSLADAHFSLGNALDAKGDVQGAITAFREAIRLNPSDAGAHGNLGAALWATGDSDGAVAAFREAYRLRPDDVMATCNLGNTLLGRGRFQEALTLLRKGHELNARRSDSRFPTAAWVKDAERKVELDGRLESVLSGTARPRDTAERLEFADLCYLKSLYADSVRMLEVAFSEAPALAEDLAQGVRFGAARSAALAGSRGEADAAEWRGKALEWLRADLAAIEKAPSKFTEMLEHWKRTPDLAGVRDRAGELPEPERAAWLAFWTRVDAAFAKARQSPR
jgi:tetratricopeptide (TPR) repeat protein